MTHGPPTNGHVEGILHQENERQDGQLRDPVHPLRPTAGAGVRRYDIVTGRLGTGLRILGDEPIPTPGGTPWNTAS